MMALPGIFPEMGISAAEDVGEADGSVEQRADQKRCSLVDPITLACLFDMAHDRFLADPHDAADFPVGFAATDPDQTVTLAIGQDGVRHGTELAGAPHPPGCFEGERAGELGERMIFVCEMF